VAAPDGSAFVVAGDAKGAYWIGRYQPATGFQGWDPLGGSFASDPVAAVAADGTVYIAGTTSAGVVFAGRYIVDSGFHGWFSGSAAPLVVGTPAITVGSDQAAYVAIRASDNALWAARVEGDTWEAWTNGGGHLRTSPGLAATGGSVYALVNSVTGPLSFRPLYEGAGGYWQAWITLSGYLNDASIAAANGHFYVVGRNATNDVWWYESGDLGWVQYGLRGLVGDKVSVAPR
jgi:hypothetical protein